MMEGTKKERHGEKGFTLIELLVIIAILGILGAVVIPKVTVFSQSGHEKAAKTELHNVRTAVTAMMAQAETSTITNPVDTFTDDLSGCYTVVNGVTYRLEDYLEKVNDLAFEYTVSASGEVVQRIP